MNDTHDPDLRSWVESANHPDSDFPIQNLPFGIFSRRSADSSPRAGVAIGDQILDVAACASVGLVAQSAAAVASAGASLNTLMALEPQALSAFRRELSLVLRADGEPGKRAKAAAGSVLVPASDATMMLPAEIRDYTDFYASIHHATNVGSMFRPDNPLLPNYKYVPIGYHGRASSIVPSGAPVRDQWVKPRLQSEAVPSFGPSKMLDYESELGFFVGTGQRTWARRSPSTDAEPAHLRVLPRQRLVGAGHTDLGVPAARAISREEFRDDDFAMGRHG